MKAGTYMATPVDHYISESRSSGEPYVRVTFNVDGDGVSWFGSFSDKAWDRTIESLRLMGFAGHDFGSMVLDKEVQIVVENDEYNGRQGSKVRWINDPAGGVKPVGDDVIKRLSAKLRLKTGGEKVGDNDIPF